MSIAARFYVREIVMHATRVSGSGWADPAPNITVKLNVVSGAKGEANKAWASATPVGEISMTIGNPDAAQWFIDRLNQDIAVSFDDRPADELAG